LLFCDNIRQEEGCIFLRELPLYLRGPVIALPDNCFGRKRVLIE
jgi:hypothetical protein